MSARQALASGMVEPGLELVPQALCSLIPTRPSLPGKEESVIIIISSHKDVIPRGLLLAVGNLAQPEPSALGHGISGSSLVWHGRNQSSHCIGLSRVLLFVTPWTVAQEAPLSMGFPRQEYWSLLLFPSPGDLLDPGIQSMSPALTEGFFTTDPLGEPQ